MGWIEPNPWSPENVTSMAKGRTFVYVIKVKISRGEISWLLQGNWM
jgi:hypothetical protein